MAGIRLQPYGSKGSIATSTSQADIVEIDMHGRQSLSIRVKPVTEAFTEFVVQGKVDPKDSDWETIALVPGDYTSPGGMIFRASEDLTTVAAGTVAFLHIQNVAFRRMRIRAKAAGTGTAEFSYNAW
ncbi:hypothetical protein LCGC14_1881260 [marine sediment metagenome]|uniref:Uncharacterized protein n=1 Tax=marine sediment metagenome TaxID=412755 RepID=A0A0F9GQI4_9ZZZZ